VGFVVDKVALGQVFSEYFCFPQSSSSIVWGWYNRPNSGRGTKLTQSHPMRKIIKTILAFDTIGDESVVK
jgi:hypothetical protein